LIAAKYTKISTLLIAARQLRHGAFRALSWFSRPF